LPPPLLDCELVLDFSLELLLDWDSDCELCSEDDSLMETVALCLPDPDLEFPEDDSLKVMLELCDDDDSLDSEEDSELLSSSEVDWLDDFPPDEGGGD
jgi:hypothetical protein